MAMTLIRRADSHPDSSEAGGDTGLPFAELPLGAQTATTTPLGRGLGWNDVRTIPRLRSGFLRELRLQ